MFDFFEFSQFDHILAVQPISLRNRDFGTSVQVVPVTSVLSSSQDIAEDILIAELVFDSLNSSDVVVSVSGQQSIYFCMRDSSLILKKGIDLRCLGSSVVKIRLKCEWPSDPGREVLFIEHAIAVSDQADTEDMLKLKINNPVSTIDFRHQSDSSSKVAELETHDILSAEHFVLFGPDADKFYIEGNNVYIRGVQQNFQCVASTLLLMIGFRETSTDGALANYPLDSGLSNKHEIDSGSVSDSGPILMSAEKFPLMYTGGAATVSITDTLLALSPSTGHLEYATIAIDDGYQHGEDILSVVSYDDQAETPVSIYTFFDIESGTFHISGKASASVYVGIIRSVVFSSTADATSDPNRVIRISVVDGNKVSNVLHREIEFVTKSLFHSNKIPTRANSCDLFLEEMRMYALDAQWLDQLLSDNGIDREYADSSQFHIIEPAGGVDVFVKGRSSFSFTVSDIASGEVFISHDGSLDCSRSMYLEFSKDGFDFAGLNFCVYLDGSKSTAQTSADLHLDKLRKSDGSEKQNPHLSNVEVIDPVSREFYIHSSRDIDHSLPGMQEFHVDLGGRRLVDQANTNDQRKSPSRMPDKEVLLSLRLPGCPGPLVVYQVLPGIQDLAKLVVEQTESFAGVDAYRDELLFTLLELNPLTVSADYSEWTSWCDKGASEKDNQRRLDRLFRTHAVALEKYVSMKDSGTQFDSSTIVRYMADGLSNGFVIWLLSSGYLARRLAGRLGVLSRAA